MTLLLNEFKDALQANDRSPLTVTGYLRDLSLFERWLAGWTEDASDPTAWDAQTVQAYRQALLDANRKSATINRKLAALVAYGQWAQEQGLLAQNPALHVRSVEKSPLAPRWLDDAQRRKLIRKVEDSLENDRQRYKRLNVIRQRDATMLLTLLHTGLRVNELCALRLSDVEIKERKGSLMVRSGKGQKQRQIPLNKDAREALDTWLKVRPPAAHDYLFVGQRGERVLPRIVQRAVSRLALEAGLEDVTPHKLRHTFSKTLIDAGETLERVATLLGHSSLNTTRIYVVPGKEDLEKAVQKLESGEAK